MAKNYLESVPGCELQGKGSPYYLLSDAECENASASDELSEAYEHLEQVVDRYVKMGYQTRASLLESLGRR